MAQNDILEIVACDRDSVTFNPIKKVQSTYKVNMNTTGSSRIDEYTKLVVYIESELRKIVKTKNVINQTTTYLRNKSIVYSDLKWKITSGTLNKNTESIIDAKLGQDTLMTLIKDNYFDKIVDPLEPNVFIDMTHLIAVLSGYLDNELIPVIPNEWSGWAGDMHSHSQEIDAEITANSNLDVDKFAMSTIASTSPNFSRNDLLSDIDARNIFYYFIHKDNNALSSALSIYFQDGFVNKRFLKFVESYGGLNNLWVKIRENTVSLINYNLNPEARFAAARAFFNLINDEYSKGTS